VKLAESKWSGLSSKPLAIGWLSLVMIVVGLALWRGPAFDSSILSLLPESDQDSLVHRASEQMNRDFSERLLLVLSGVDEPALRSAVATMAGALAPLAEVARVDWRVAAADVVSQRNELYPYRFALLDEALREQLLADEYGRAGARALARLFGPLAGSGSLIGDPFGLYFELRLNRAPELNLQIADSLLKIAGSRLPSYLLVLTLAGDPFSPALQERVLGVIAEQRQQLAAAVEEMTMSGMLLHAAAGAQQAEREISTIGVGSLIGIVVAMLLVFRRLRPLLLLMFPIAVGCLFASAASLLIFDKVHLVTFAFGAGLVGVSVDYALHFLCERQVTAASGVLPRILPGLLLALFSSVAAYAAQAIAPFPGLRQMAVFSVLGLGASWLTVVLWFPLLAGSERLQPLVIAGRIDRLRRRFPKLESSPLLAVMLVLVLVVAGVSVWNGEARDDIRLLQTSPQRLLEQERQLHNALGSSGGARFMLVTADTLEACLQREEQLRPALQALQQDGDIDGFNMLSSWLPSLARQAQNIDLVSELYRLELSSFFARLKLPPARLAAARAAFDQDRANRLTPELWLQLAGSAAQRNLLVVHDAAEAATVVRFKGELSVAALQRLTELATSVAGVSFVDQVHTVSELLGRYRVQIAGWILIAYLVVAAVLLLRYRRELWRIILPPFAASLITLAILLQLQQGINLFHIMAMILVLGIGLDMGIFLTETEEAPHTWLAVSLLSDTPVLHHFGVTVALGLSLAWLLAPLMRRNSSVDSIDG
jgi:predicted exporter